MSGNNIKGKDKI